jgi:hypothetical protein
MVDICFAKKRGEKEGKKSGTEIVYIRSERRWQVQENKGTLKVFLRNGILGNTANGIIQVCRVLEWRIIVKQAATFSEC